MVATAAAEDVVLTATLGSCVAIIFHDPILKVGGMTHIFQCVDPGPAGGAAVVAQIEKLVNDMMRLNSSRVALQARVVGGARTLGRGRNVGGEIAEVTLAYLRAERIILVDSDVGGHRPRRIIFHPSAGGLLISYPGYETVTPEPVAPQIRPEDTEIFFSSKAP